MPERVVWSAWAGSHNFLGLPSLFWVLGDDVLETLLHTPRDPLDQLRGGFVSKRVSPSAGVSILTGPIYVVPPARWLSLGSAEPQKFQTDDPVDVALSGEKD
jgi:hypothetical protein